MGNPDLKLCKQYIWEKVAWNSSRISQNYVSALVGVHIHAKPFPRFQCGKQLVLARISQIDDDF